MIPEFADVTNISYLFWGQSVVQECEVSAGEEGVEGEDMRRQEKDTC